MEDSLRMEGEAGQGRARRGEARRDADCRGQIRVGHQVRTRWTIVWYGTGRNVYVCMYVFTVSRQAEGGSGFGLGSCSMSLV